MRETVYQLQGKSGNFLPCARNDMSISSKGYLVEFQIHDAEASARTLQRKLNVAGLYTSFDAKTVACNNEQNTFVGNRGLFLITNCNSYIPNHRSELEN